MLRRRKPRLRQSQVPERRDSSRLSELVINNPVNQSSFWSQDILLLEDLVTRFPLPQVVRCASRLVPGEERNLPVNVHVPMLLCAGRTARKLLAKHVGNDVRTQRLMETDDSIVIPHDYEGNFLRLRCRTTKDKSVVRSPMEIAQSQCQAFVSFSLITAFTTTATHTQTDNNINHKNGEDHHGSSNNISNSKAGGVNGGGSQTGSKSSKGNKQNGELQRHTRTVYPPGSVFIVTSISKGQARDKQKSREVILIKCTDEGGREVLIPSDQPGECVEIEKPTTEQSKLSMRPEELISANRYPNLVRYVYGPHPPRLTPCSKLFTLIDTFEEDSLIGCLLYPGHALMIEMPMTSSLAFQVALNREEVMAMPLPRHAMEVVQGRRETFVKDLKLKCKFLHKVNQGISQSKQSLNQTEDDMPSATVRTRQYANEAFFYL